MPFEWAMPIWNFRWRMSVLAMEIMMAQLAFMGEGGFALVEWPHCILRQIPRQRKGIIFEKGTRPDVDYSIPLPAKRWNVLQRAMENYLVKSMENYWDNKLNNKIL